MTHTPPSMSRAKSAQEITQHQYVVNATIAGRRARLGNNTAKTSAGFGTRCPPTALN